MMRKRVNVILMKNCLLLVICLLGVVILIKLVLAAPVLNSVILNLTSGTNLTSDNLTVYTDQDNNASVKLIYNWKKDGNSIAVLNMPFEGGSNSTFTKDYSPYRNNGTVGYILWKRKK